jgi:prolyl-tRNA editing enzyme YbaK/EbsC (Cys-tRNA(Pro) deacylase)
LLENKKAAAADDDPTNPKFVLVVIQYAATLDVKKLGTAVRALRRDVKTRLEESAFDFRIASEEDNREITGYEHNSVTPFGLLKPVPVFVSAALEPLKFFWMGGGHEHLKLGMAFSDFCRALSPIVADISQPRTAMEMASADQLGF